MHTGLADGDRNVKDHPTSREWHVTELRRSRTRESSLKVGVAVAFCLPRFATFPCMSRWQSGEEVGAHRPTDELFEEESWIDERRLGVDHRDPSPREDRRSA
jgi:hypothetical protein